MAALRVSGFDGFERFLGPLPPVAATAAAGALGLGAAWLLEKRGFWHPSARSRTVRGLVVASALTVPFAAVAIAVDIAVGFPRATNVSWPEAWLFYPAIAVAAESVFHLLPLGALALATRSRFTRVGPQGRVRTLTLAAATVEPAAQVALGSALPAFVMPHVYVLGVVHLILLRRYGYLPMLWFRVCYYLLWHVLWGAARLPLLFGA